MESAAAAQRIDALLEKPRAQGSEEVRDDDEGQANEKGAAVGLEIRKERSKLVHKGGLKCHRIAEPEQVTTKEA